MPSFSHMVQFGLIWIKRRCIKYKKELLLAAPFYEFPIGTISKVKKIVLGS